MKKKIDINKIILFTIILVSIFPVIKMSWFSMPVLYLLIPLEIFVLLLLLLGKIKTPKVTKTIILMYFLILLEIFISAFAGTISTFNRFVFPTDSIQYVARFLIFITLTTLFYHGKFKVDDFIKYFLIMLNIGMIIGILQWIPWPGREFLIILYPFREGVEQLSHLTRSLSGIRIHGLAQMATANGGLATFFFIFGLSIYKYYNKYRMLSIALMLFSIINVFASQARAGILALICSLLLFYFIDIYLYKKGGKATLTFIGTSLITSIIFWVLYEKENPVILRMIYRWEVLFETNGGARVDQVDYFLSLINNSLKFLFGLSKPVVNESIMSYGVEIEPVYIFVLYGFLGFILQYSLIVFLAIYFISIMRKSLNNKAILALIVASFIGLVSYQVFSVAYYFYREVRVGLFPWILMGVTIGAYERYKKYNSESINKERKQLEIQQRIKHLN